MKRIAMFVTAAAMMVSHPVAAQPGATRAQPAANTAQSLPQKQQAIAPIAAATAVGDMPRLNQALNQGLDAGLTLSESKEILVQMYAYTGFPRSLNALGELMKVVEARKQRGIQDAPGREAGPVPSGRELLQLGTANQTKLVGTPVRGALFEFVPVIDEYLKSHLFGAMFARDNLDWQSRELATVGALAALPGAESQLQSHVGFSMNVGLTAAQLRQVADVLAQGGYPEAAGRARAAIVQVEATKK
ncbi:MAG TPA: carboxymuconolactone decarboxylase family protein [Ramlibacter sp.]|jgi:alkylhydroperoxidase/carboxymuconolactone decarboxylase family protein YurZ